MNCDDYVAVLLKISERKSENCNFIAVKLDLEYLLCTNPIGFFLMLSPFTALGCG